MLRFDGKGLRGNHSVTLYDRSGASLGTVFAINGVAKAPCQPRPLIAPKQPSLLNLPADPSHRR